MIKNCVLIAIALCAAFLVFIGCDDEENPSVQATMQILEAPTALPGGVDTFYTYRIMLSGATADSIYCDIQGYDGFALFDDGGTAIRHRTLTDSVSGDDWASNGTFTARLNPSRLGGGVPANYVFTFRVLLKDDIPSRTINVLVAEVEPCIIQSPIPIETLLSCFSPFDVGFQVEISDADSVTDAHIELLHAATDTQIIAGMTLPRLTNGYYRKQITPEFFRCVSTNAPGSFWVRYWARTAFGMECVSDYYPVTYSNQLPVLSNCTLPDTAYRPTSDGDSNLIVVTVNMDDCELLNATDYYGLEFEVSRDNPTDWSRNGDFFLRDDGTEPDANAGDGTFSSWLVIDYRPIYPNNMYYFRFYAIEGFAPCVARWDSSEYLLDSIRIIQPGANLAINPPGDSDPLGIHVWQETRE